MRYVTIALCLLFVACRTEPAPDAPAGGDSLTARLPDEAAGPCLLMPDDTLTLFVRPSPASDEFGIAAPGEALRPTATAEGGWLGFDPAVAQAANVGPFRLRWVAPDGPFTLTGACRTLPVIAAPTDGCYLMAGLPIALREAPDAGASVVDTLRAEGFAPVVGRAADGWSRVRLPDAREAWAAPEDGSFNGPCDESSG